ncbi:monofunctional biosynthetic peptidoglycan transglycosylase [Nitrosomonas communis]|uniref:monofunctional biosynthetic peptidoglycan transglycosylase n=1 Tax=Nitrosomonas communis TaxID=44574 RepID=UPI0026F0E491|nr:monofunctional biosynthetic peptidoglycan transglycosylase [Nitrosomonas communis]MCO6426728.1 monofunctional biosynthetic peptidoglycan transglycosylase [Nitrosomonas communis]
MAKLLKRWPWRLSLLASCAALLYLTWILLHIVYWNTYNPRTSAFMQSRLETLRQLHADATVRHQWVAYEHISPHLKRAIIAAEDSQFMKHNGFDFQAIQHALEKNIKQGEWVAGGSTISQQLAKNLFLSDQKTVWRKFEEMIITIMLEHMMPKRRILEIYLNMIEWGHDVFGAEAAALHYFGVSASGLSARQAAFLASMIPNPRYYDRNRKTQKLLKKSNIILSRMPLAQIP